MCDHQVFTLDDAYFPLHMMRELVHRLYKRNQRYIAMVDPAAAYRPGSGYGPYDCGKEASIFMKNADGTEYRGVVWPG